jgi:hypothetical protein
MSDDIAVYCRSGHFVGLMPEASHRSYFPGRLRQMAEDQYVQDNERQNFCAEYGEPSPIEKLPKGGFTAPAQGYLWLRRS